MPSKIKDMQGSAAQKYIALVHGDVPIARIIANELLVFLFADWPGPLGVWLRQKFWPKMFRKCGRKPVFGRGMVIRHASKIELGDNCIIDDETVLDAKGGAESGITLGDGVYIGRRSIVYCKGGKISLGARTNISANCTMFSSNSLTVGGGCMIGAYSYFLSGGEYSPNDPAPFADQSGMNSRGPLVIGDDCWFGARVTVLDAAQNIGRRVVVGAGAVVTKPVKENKTVVGIPAREL